MNYSFRNLANIIQKEKGKDTAELIITTYDNNTTERSKHYCDRQKLIIFINDVWGHKYDCSIHK
jgi:hypothetical protein